MKTNDLSEAARQSQERKWNRRGRDKYLITQYPLKSLPVRHMTPRDYQAFTRT